MKLQPQLLTGMSGPNGLNAQPLADLGPESELEHAVNQLLEGISSVLETLLSWKIVDLLSVQVKHFHLTFVFLTGQHSQFLQC